MRTLVVCLVALTILGGCSNDPVAPGSAAALALSTGTLARPNPLDKWRPPKLQVSTDTWKGFQVAGVTFDPATFATLPIAPEQPVTFHWSARPKSGNVDLAGFRWALDIADPLDETPRGSSGDVTHWSAWSATETSATVGPFDASAKHFFYVEVRDALGFVTLAVVRLEPTP